MPPWIYEPRLNFEPYTGVTLLKVHGSINWFDLGEYYEKQKTDNVDNPMSLFPSDFIFNNQGLDKPQLNPILPLNIESKIETNLKHLYWVTNQDLSKYIKIYNNPIGRIYNNEAPALTHPAILSPAYSKLLYSEAIKDIFYGASFYGRENDQVIIIGCSLATYDPYIRQWVFEIIRQYYGMHHSKKISIISAPVHWKQKNLIKKNYSYLGENNLDIIFDGFSQESLKKCLKI